MIKYCILILTVLSLSCKKESSNTPLSNTIMGRWQLQSYGGGFTGRMYTARPDSVILELKANQTYQKIVEGRVQQLGKYQLGQTQSIFTGKTDNAIKFDNEDIWSIVTIDGNTLDISLNAYDGGSASYVKK